MDQSPSPAEVYISVDIEAAGPHPHDYSLLTIGACAVDEMAQMFYIELQPGFRSPITPSGIPST